MLEVSQRGPKFDTEIDRTPQDHKNTRNTKLQIFHRVSNGALLKNLPKKFLIFANGIDLPLKKLKPCLPSQIGKN